MNWSMKMILPKTRPPMIIIIIAMLYLMAALSSLTYIDSANYFVPPLESAACIIMAQGLFSMRKWARLAELVICYTQIIGSLTLGYFVLYGADDVLKHTVSVFLVLVFAAAALIGGLIIWFLNKSEVREKFH